MASKEENSMSHLFELAEFSIVVLETDGTKVESVRRKTMRRRRPRRSA
jgi:hypothetical protein